MPNRKPAALGYAAAARLVHEAALGMAQQQNEPDDYDGRAGYLWQGTYSGAIRMLWPNLTDDEMHKASVALRQYTRRSMVCIEQGRGGGRSGRTATSTWWVAAKWEISSAAERSRPGRGARAVEDKAEATYEDAVEVLTEAGLGPTEITPAVSDEPKPPLLHTYPQQPAAESPVGDVRPDGPTLIDLQRAEIASAVERINVLNKIIEDLRDECNRFDEAHATALVERDNALTLAEERGRALDKAQAELDDMTGRAEVYGMPAARFALVDMGDAGRIVIALDVDLLSLSSAVRKRIDLLIGTVQELRTDD